MGEAVNPYEVTLQAVLDQYPITGAIYERDTDLEVSVRAAVESIAAQLRLAEIEDMESTAFNDALEVAMVADRHLLTVLQKQAAESAGDWGEAACDWLKAVGFQEWVDG